MFDYCIGNVNSDDMSQWIFLKSIDRTNARLTFTHGVPKEVNSSEKLESFIEENIHTYEGSWSAETEFDYLNFHFKDEYPEMEKVRVIAWEDIPEFKELYDDCY